MPTFYFVPCLISPSIALSQARPLNPRERDEGYRICVQYDDPTNQVVMMAVDKTSLFQLRGSTAKGYAFDKRYNPEETSDKIYEECVANLVEGCFKVRYIGSQRLSSCCWRGVLLEDGGAQQLAPFFWQSCCAFCCCLVYRLPRSCNFFGVRQVAFLIGLHLLRLACRASMPPSWPMGRRGRARRTRWQGALAF